MTTLQLEEAPRLSWTASCLQPADDSGRSESNCTRGVSLPLLATDLNLFLFSLLQLNAHLKSLETERDQLYSKLTDEIKAKEELTGKPSGDFLMKQYYLKSFNVTFQRFIKLAYSIQYYNFKPLITIIIKQS